MINKSYSAILCQTKNQVNHIRLLFEEKIQERSILLPPIMTLSEWLSEQYQEFCMTGPVNELLIILSGIEEAMLWKSIIDNDLRKRNYTLLDTDEIVKQALSADQIIRNYQIDTRGLKESGLSKESAFLCEWRNEFNAYCAEKKIFSRMAFIEHFIKQQIKYRIISGNDLLFVGFDNNTPLYDKLLKAFEGSNKISHYINKKNNQQTVEEISFAKPDLEIMGVINWVKQKIDEGAKKLLIISPALSNIQINLQNKINREIDPDIFKNVGKESIYDSDLQRPLTNEPIVSAGLGLLDLAHPNQKIKPKRIYESLLFNNWIDVEGYREREKLGNYLKGSRKPSYSINLLHQIINNNPRVMSLELDSLTNTLKILDKYRASWSKPLKISGWIDQLERFWLEVKFSEINKLLPFEINNLNTLYASLHELKNNHVIDGFVKFDTFIEVLYLHLESWPAPTKKGQSLIDIQGFYENPVKEYDAVWLMNMNENFWPGQVTYNSLLPIKIQKQYHVFDEEYTKKIDMIHKDRLKKFSACLTISYSKTDVDGSPQFKSLNYFSNEKENHPSNTAAGAEVFSEYLVDSDAPKITGNKFISRGRSCLENFQRCPAWAFYENRLGAFIAQEDEEEGLSKMSRGTIVHELLEDFWGQCRDSKTLKSIPDVKIKINLEQMIQKKLKSYQTSHPFLTSLQIDLEAEYFSDLLCRWLFYEKHHRGTFIVSETEKEFTARIGRLSFNLKIDRIDEYIDGSKILIDYKTGANPPKISDYHGDMKSVQMPLYAAFSGVENLGGIAISKVDIVDQRIYGLASHPQLPKDGELEIGKKMSWESLVSSWHEQIFTIASKYLDGESKVTFTNEKDLEYCNVKPILRLGDKKRQFEEENDV